MNSESTPAFQSAELDASLREALGDVCMPGSMADFAAAMSQRHRNVLRLRRGIDARDLPIPTTPVPWYKLAHRPLSDQPRPSRHLAYASADYYLQDAGSLLALAAADADGDALGGWLVCDLCAAPGGKASALVEAIGVGGSNRAGFVLANEAIRSRIGALQLNMARTGSDRYAISNLDPDRLAGLLPGVFDMVLVDAPCSGQALLSRGKQKRSSLSTKQIRHCASRQQRILDAAMRLLREGGKLVYSTCTFSEAENEAQFRRMIQSGGAQAAPVKRLADYQSEIGCYRLWPHLHACAGSFAACLTVTQVPSLEREDRSKRFAAEKGRPGKPRCRRVEGRVGVDLCNWFDAIGDAIRLSHDDSRIFGWPSDAPSWVEELAVGGPELAHLAGQTWKPSHAAALRRVERAKRRNTVEIDDQAAMAFLRGEPIEMAGREWHVVCRNGRGIGWVKGNGSIGKNHLPAAARMTGELWA